MTLKRVKWSAEGESVVSEADDKEHANDVVERAVQRAADHFTHDGVRVDTESFYYTWESTTEEPG
jgi:hypothetical protein